MSTWTGKLAPLCVVAALTIGLSSGCGESQQSQASSSNAPMGAARPAAGQDGAQSAASGGSAAGSAPSAGNAANSLTNVTPTARDIIFTASLTVRIKDVESATANATQLVESVGGFVGDEKAQSGTVPGVAGITEATVTLRVPSTKFDSVLGQLGTGGTIESQSRSASDVTDQVVDTTSRITSQEASIARITDLMKSAGNLGDVVSLEGELSRREADLDSMKSKLAALQDQVSMSSITVTYHVPDAQVAAAPPAPAKKRNALQTGLHDGWVAFTAVGKVLLVVGGAVLPFALIAAVLWWPVRRLVRLGARRRPAGVVATGVASAGVASAGTAAVHGDEEGD